MRWLPRFYSTAALGCILAGAVAVMRARVEFKYTALAALALVSVPHNGEVFMNTANLQWMLAPLLFLLAIQKNPRSLGEATSDILILGVLGLTGPFSILWLPFLVLRPILFGRSRYNVLFAGTAVATATIQFAQMYSASLDPRAALARPEIPSPGIIAETFATRFANTLFLGTTRPTFWNFAILSVIALAAVYILLSSTRAVRIQGLAILAAGAFVYIASMVRVHFDLRALEPTMRYQYIPSVMIVWFFVLGLNSPGRSARVAAGLILSLIFCATTHHPKRGQLEDLNWPRHAERIRQAESKGQTVMVPINPGWKIPVAPRWAKLSASVQDNDSQTAIGGLPGTIRVVWQSPVCAWKAIPIEQPRELVISNPADAIHCVDVRLGAYGVRNPGFVRLEILRETGSVLAESEIVAAEAMHDEFQAFELREPVRAKGQRLRLRLSYRKSSSEQGAIFAWSPPEDNNAFDCRVFGH